MTTFTRTMTLALLTALAGTAQAADYSFTFAPVLTEDTPNARAAMVFKGEAKIIDRIKGEITIQELSPEGRAAFVVASQPIYADFRDKVTPALMDKALALAKGE